MKNSREYKQVWAIRARGSLYCSFLCEFFKMIFNADSLSRYVCFIVKNSSRLDLLTLVFLGQQQTCAKL